MAFADGSSIKNKQVAIYKRRLKIAEHGTDSLQVNTLLMYRWEINTKLAIGGCSVVYGAYDRVRKMDVAIKTERTSKRLNNEAAILRQLSGLPNFCEYIHYQHTQELCFLVMDLHGPNLKELIQHYRPISWRTAMNCGIQMLYAIEELHSLGYVHGDIKPSSFVSGRPPNSTSSIILIDFGLAECLKDNNISRRILPNNQTTQNKMLQPAFQGTMKYASPSIHRGYRMSRRDDLWSLLYTILELLTELPWNNISSHGKVLEIKLKKIDSLVEDHLGLELKAFLIHLQRLTLPDKPDYEFILECFMNALERNKATGTWPFEWERNPHLVWNIKYKTLLDDNPPTVYLTDAQNVRLARATNDQGTQAISSTDMSMVESSGILNLESMSKAKDLNSSCIFDKKKRKRQKVPALTISRLMAVPKDYADNKEKYSYNVIFFKQAPIDEESEDGTDSEDSDT